VRVERTPVSLPSNCKKHFKEVPRLTQNTTCKHEYLRRGLTRPNVEHSGNVQGSFAKHSGNLQGTLKEGIRIRFLNPCGESFTLCGESTALCGESLTLCGEFTALCGESLTLCGESLTMCGEFTALCGESLTLCGESTALCGESLTLCGESLTLCGESTALCGESLTLCVNSPQVKLSERSGGSRHALTEAFHYFDVHARGRIDAEQFRCSCRRLTMELTQDEAAMLLHRSDLYYDDRIRCNMTG
jgi:hypothetical protein